MSRSLSGALAAAALVLVAAPAGAQTVPMTFYVSGAAGRSHVDVDCTGLDTCSRSDTAYKLVGGWNINDGLAAELTYYSLGRAKFAGTAAGVSASWSVRASYIGIGLAGHYDFTPQLAAVIRGGWASGTAKTDESVAGFGSVSESRDGTSHGYYGAGVIYNIDRHVRLELDYDWTRVASSVGGIKSTDDVPAVMFGAGYTF